MTFLRLMNHRPSTVVALIAIIADALGWPLVRGISRALEAPVTDPPHVAEPSLPRELGLREILPTLEVATVAEPVVAAATPRELVVIVNDVIGATDSVGLEPGSSRSS